MHPRRRSPDGGGRDQAGALGQRNARVADRHPVFALAPAKAPPADEMTSTLAIKAATNNLGLTRSSFRRPTGAVEL